MEEVLETGQPEVTPAPAAPSGDSYKVPEKFKGATPEESLAKMGKSYAELEKQLGQRNQTPAEIAEIKNSLTELREAILSRQPTEPKEGEDIAGQQKDWIKSLGFTTQEDIEKAREQGRKDYELSSMMRDLEKKYDGKDGRPAFQGEDISKFAVSNGYQGLPPETIYKLKFEQELDDWKAKQVLKGNRAPIVPSGGKKPLDSEPDYKKLTPEQVNILAKEKALALIQAQD